MRARRGSMRASLGKTLACGNAREGAGSLRPVYSRNDLMAARIQMMAKTKCTTMRTGWGFSWMDSLIARPRITRPAARRRVALSHRFFFIFCHRTGGRSCGRVWGNTAQKQLTPTPSKIAQPFMAGSTAGKVFEVPPGTKEILAAIVSFVPPGLGMICLTLSPALKHWAIFKTYQAASRRAAIGDCRRTGGHSCARVWGISFNCNPHPRAAPANERAGSP